MSARAADLLREAGAILPGSGPHGKAPKDRAVDAITARAYAHPALAGRVVVRLVPATLGEAEDLSMEFLGFATAGKPVVVGHGRRQALGFPAWALVNDPANGRHALALVKEMERLARVAKSKPGNAKDGYDQLAVRLGAAAPHFLPTFWEQAGRAFLAAENAKAAGTCFAAARLAEQVHGLVVDEERLREVHLEFAFAGALTAKALSEYARQVGDRRPAPEAYELVRTIGIRRVAGGLPPYASMADDLKRLAKAAGLSPDAEAEAVIAELLAYPAVNKAHEGFWKSYRAALVRVAKRDPAVRGRLLALLPDPPGYDVDVTDMWLELLEDTGATQALRTPGKVPAEAAPPGGVAAWVQRFLNHRDSSWRRKPRSPRWLALLTEIADEVRVDLVGRGAALAVSPSGHWRPDFDVLDICLATAVPVSDDPAQLRYTVRADMRHWMSGPYGGRRDLAAVAADERFLPALILGLRDWLGAWSDGRSDTRRQAAVRKQDWRLEPAGLRTAMMTWLASLSREGTSAPTVRTVADVLDSFAPLWTRGGVALATDVFDQWASVDIAESLARTLRGGFPAELTWPAYEQAYAQFKGARLTGAWPAIVLHDHQHAVVVGPDGVLLEHAFRLPPGVTGDYLEVTYVDEQLRVAWPKGCYWSGRPGEVIEHEHAQWSASHHSWISLALPGGGRTTGHRPWRAGDSEVPQYAHIASDGTSFWRVESVDDGSGGHRQGWREYDPHTGDPGRFSQPAFFDVALDDGDTAEPGLSLLRPAPDGFAGSPLGWRDGRVGWRVVRHRDGSVTGTGVDGRTVTSGSLSDGEAALGAVVLPGADQPRLVTSGRSRVFGAQANVVVWDVGGEERLSEAAAVGALLPPTTYWHALRPRDEPGSQALRAMDAERASQLLQSCAAAEPADVFAEAQTAVARVLPQVTQEPLANAVARAVSAAEEVRRLQESLQGLLVAAPDAPPEAGPAPIAVSDDDLQRACAGLQSRQHYAYHPNGRGLTEPMVAQIEAVVRVLRGGSVKEFVHADGLWLRLLPCLGAVVMRAASPLSTAADRAALRGLLTALRRLDLAGTDPRARVVEVVPAKSRDFTGLDLVWRGGSSTLLLIAFDQTYDSNGHRWSAHGLQVSPTGEFDLPESLALVSGHPFRGWGDPERLDAAIALLQQGPAPWFPECVDELVAATGRSRAEAALLLAALPKVSTWKATFLDAEERQLLGLKPVEARTARDALRDLPGWQRRRLLDAAMPADPADLWRRGPDVAALARRWIEYSGRTAKVPDDLLSEATRILPTRQSGYVLRTIAQPMAGDWLHTDGAPSEDDRGRMVARQGEPFTGAYLRVAAVALPWLAYRLPAGDPLRAQLPVVYQLIRERLRNDQLLIGAEAHRRATVPDGLPALVAGRQHDEWTYYHVAPARLSGVDDPAIAFLGDANRSSLRLMLSDEFAAAMAALAEDPTPPGRYPHDPTLSAPDVVDAIVAAHNLSRDAAAYYLQLLALPDPTDRHVLEWNGWPAATLRVAKASLADTDLVVEAKRERSGRSLFLPGGWRPLKAPDVPIEAWKEGLMHGVTTGRVLVITSVADLFRRAWGRVVAGDHPRYQELSEAR